MKKDTRPKRRTKRYRKLGGLLKECACDRKRWSECRHPWLVEMQHLGTRYRFSLNKRARKPRGYMMPKSEADKLYETCRDQILDGTFDTSGATTNGDTRLSFGDVADRYIREYAPFINGERGRPRREGGHKLMEWMTNGLKRVEIPARGGKMIALKDKPIADITTADVEAVRINWPLKKKAPKGGTTGPDRALKRLRHLFNWAIRTGIVESSPFRKAHLSVITFETEDGRTRRLEDGEEQRLRAAAQYDDQRVARQPGWLDDLIVAALETGCRQGELLKLQWSQVHWPTNHKRGHLFLPSVKTKTKRDRAVPITKPLLAILEMRKHGPDGKEHGPDAYVFGNSVGEVRKDIKTQWHRVLTAAKITNLRFHDLRREAASRWLESGVVPLHEISAWLGHADIKTTSIYLRAKSTGVMHAADRLEQFREEQERQKKRDAKNAKRRSRRRPPTSAPTSGGASYTIN
jgi:integrase